MYQIKSQKLALLILEKMLENEKLFEKLYRSFSLEVVFKPIFELLDRKRFTWESNEIITWGQFRYTYPDNKINYSKNFIKKLSRKVKFKNTL